MDSKTLSIGVLTLTAVLLLLGNYFISSSAEAQVAVKERDFTMVTARTQTGNDALYIVDNRTGLIAVFSFDPATQSVRPQAVRPVADAFFVE